MAATTSAHDLTSSKTWSPALYDNHANFVHSKNHTTAVVTLLDPQPSDRILDLGCGDAALTRRLVTEHGASYVVGLDASEAMIKAAKERCAEQVDDGRMVFEVVDGVELEKSRWSGQAFDKVFSNAGELLIMSIWRTFIIQQSHLSTTLDAS